MHNVFICHAREDQGIAERVCEFLEGQGLKCWIGPRDSTAPGAAAPNAALDAVGACSAMVLIFSGSANVSDEIYGEVEAAVKLRKLLIPFRIENIPPGEKMQPFFQRRYIHDAFTPPLEKHLEELARLLRPLTFKRAVDNTEEALLSRTLPSRASVERSSKGGQPLNEVAPGPVRISFNFDRVLVGGYTSTFDVLVENTGLENLQNVEIALESRSLRRPVASKWADLPVDKSVRAQLPIEPFRSEQSVVHVTVTCRAGQRQMTLVGARSLRVHEVPTPEQLAQGTGPLLENRLHTNPFITPSGFGALSPSVEKFGSLPEFLNFQSPENFEPLELALDHEVGVAAIERANRRGTLRIPEVFLGRVDTGSRLLLVPVKSPLTVPHQEIRLVGRRNFHLGRSPEESDFLLWFWPRSEVHDTKTRRISKKHCTLNIQGGRACVCNTAAASLTMFDGQDVAPGLQGVPLDHRGILNFSGIYFLETLRFPSSSLHGPAIENIADHPARKSSAERAAWNDSVRFVQLTPHVLPQYSTWLPGDGTFGTSNANPVLLNIDELDEIQGRFYYHQDSFWLENLVDNGAVLIDGHAVEPGSIVPLATGQKVRLADREFTVKVDS